jgi:Ca-activated chloride channel family protein
MGAAMTRSLAAVPCALTLLALQGSPQLPAFRTGTDMVRLDVSVTRGGRPARDLSASDFRVTDNGIAQRVSLMSLDELPVSVALVLDASESVTGEPLAWLQDAAGRFVGQLRQGDRAAVLSFSEAVALQCPLTADLADAQRGLRRVRAGGGTALYDAVYAATKILERSDTPRRLVVVFSDGADNFSWLRRETLFGAVRRSDAVLYAISARTPEVVEPPNWDRVTARFAQGRAVPGAGDRVLQDLAETLGGEVFGTAWNPDLGRVFDSVLQAFRSRHVLAYVPAGPATPGWHAVTVTVRGGGDIRVRRGYWR